MMLRLPYLFSFSIFLTSISCGPDVLARYLSYHHDMTLGDAHVLGGVVQPFAERAGRVAGHVHGLPQSHALVAQALPRPHLVGGLF